MNGAYGGLISPHFLRRTVRLLLHTNLQTCIRMASYDMSLCNLCMDGNLDGLIYILS